ncbi:response regulator transcription factor [Paenibacillus senegalensis]|uniref:response regulator transcription factor n=1 Tax=Paenibacillus senegalensis TaxID=1465766 RepID=UPI00028A31AD|nr:response regulator [Paenibacillus senegalensis]
MYSVLVVDDEYMIKRSLTKMIEEARHRFTIAGEAEDGKEAWTKVEQLKPDILITDICMPVMDGLALIQEVREKYKFIEPIIISGHDEFAYAQKAVQFGVHDYLLKPLRPDALYKTLDRVYTKLEERNERFARHGEWTAFCRDAAVRITEHMLLFNEGGILAELAEGYERMLKLEQDLAPYPLKNMVQDLLSACHALLVEKYGDTFLEFASLNTTLLSADHYFAHMRTSILRMMNELRSKKHLKINMKVNQAIELINQRFTEVISLEEVAQAVGLTPSYFSSAFGESVGMSFVHYVTRLRMAKAQTLLKDTSLKTYEVAELVGYMNYPHFSRAFKKYTGVSPGRFRKQT